MDDMELTPAMRRLDQAAKDYAASMAARQEKLAALQTAIRDADAEGINKRADIIRLSGVARQTVYDALEEDDPEGSQPAGVS